MDEESACIEALTSQFAAQGYKMCALFRDVAASPDSYRIKLVPPEAPLDAGTSRVCSLNR